MLIVGDGPMVKQREFGFHAGSTNDTEEYDIENLQERYNFQLLETWLRIFSNLHQLFRL